MKTNSLVSLRLRFPFFMFLWIGARPGKAKGTHVEMAKSRGEANAQRSDLLKRRINDVLKSNNKPPPEMAQATEQRYNLRASFSLHLRGERRAKA